MPTPANPLHDLAQRIQQQEADLARLRKELAARQTTLSELTHRREELQAQLRKIEAEMLSVGQVEIVQQDSSPSPTAKFPRVKPGPKPAGGVSLPKFLVGLVRAAGGPITTKELTAEVVRQKFPTTSKNLQGMVEARVYDLLKKGILRKAGDQPGVILGEEDMLAQPAKAKIGRPSGFKQTAKPTSPTGKKLTLHQVLTEVLAQSPRPLTTQELADQAVAHGYVSRSQDLKNVIWVSIGKMTNIERLRGEGYRLKKGKGRQ